MVKPVFDVGARCSVNVSGSWQPATVRRVNEDGTLTVEPDAKALAFMPRWYGLTAAEVAVGDEAARSLDGARPVRFFPFYWNQVRMGGRDPADLTRPITIEDALVALGLARQPVDAAAEAAGAAVGQAHGVGLPATWSQLASRTGAGEAVRRAHPNDPELLPPEEWLVEPLAGHPDGSHALVVMVPHQGDHEWVLVFRDGDPDAPVYLRWPDLDPAEWRLTAPSVAWFFWDLAQTGLGWFLDNGPGNRIITRTDIGLAAVAAKAET